MAATNSTSQVALDDAAAVRASVSKYYGETLQSTSDLKTSACCTAKAPPKEVVDVLRCVPEEVRSKYYGCGSPFPVGMSGQPLRVLDLGCGSGRDCYVCAALVGKDGHVTGVDMTPAQLAVAEAHAAEWTSALGYDTPNMTFLKGTIEDLAAAGVGEASQDLVISNCVINLSPDKAACLQQVARVLVEGGEMYFSDVYCDRRLPAEVRGHEVLLGECLGGALYVNDFLDLAKKAGFTDPRVLEAEEIMVHDQQLKQLLGKARFFSVTFRLYKLPDLDAEAEDYGQTATYLGAMPSSPESYALDSSNTFPAGSPVPVSANTAAMLSGSWLSKHFKVEGVKEERLHRGMVAGHRSLAVANVVALAEAGGGPAGGSCCGPAAPSAGQAAAVGGDSSCCAPAAPSKAACCGPAAPAKASCCAPPAPAAKAGAGGSCCAPAAPAPAGNGSCCAPAAKAGPAGGCAPAAVAKGSCCGPSSS